MQTLNRAILTEPASDHRQGESLCRVEAKGGQIRQRTCHVEPGQNLGIGNHQSGFLIIEDPITEQGNIQIDRPGRIAIISSLASHPSLERPQNLLFQVQGLQMTENLDRGIEKRRRLWSLIGWRFKYRGRSKYLEVLPQKPCRQREIHRRLDIGAQTDQHGFQLTNRQMSHEIGSGTIDLDSHRLGKSECSWLLDSNHNSLGSELEHRDPRQLAGQRLYEIVR